MNSFRKNRRGLRGGGGGGGGRRPAVGGGGGSVPDAEGGTTEARVDEPGVTTGTTGTTTVGMGVPPGEFGL